MGLLLGTRRTLISAGERYSEIMRSFYPEDFGAIGDGATDDTAAIQAAIDAATSNGGGRVLLSRTYAISTAGIRNFGQYANVNYSLLVSADNVHIWGPGTLVLNERPEITGTTYTALAMGVGDSEIENVGCHGLTIDASALTVADLTAISAAGVGAALSWYASVNWVCEGNTIINGWGYNGALQSIIRSRHGRITGNYINGSHKTGLWLDGLRYSTVAQNRVVEAGVHGIFIATNSDYLYGPQQNVLANNYILNSEQIGIGIAGGTDNLIQGNTVITGEGYGAYITSAANAAGNWPSSRNSIVGNILRMTAGVAQGIILIGTDVSPFDGTQVPCERTLICGNTISGWGAGVYLRASAINNRIVSNHIFDVIVPVHSDVNPTITGNIVENMGAATIGDGGTIAHQCADAPAVVNLTPSAANEFASVTATDDTNITVAIKKHDGTPGNNQAIYWRTA